MKIDTDVIIVGGGLNGPALALALASGGLKSIVIDAMPRNKRQEPEFDGRSYALSVGSVKMLKALGIWSEVEQNAQPICDVIVSDGRAGEGASPLFLHFDHREIEEGPVGYMLEDRYLRRALLNALDADPLVKQISPAKVVGQIVEDGSAKVTLDDGKDIVAKMIVGCDGRRSDTATRAGIERHHKSYHQISQVCAVDHEKPHNGAAHQFFMPSGPLAILPLSGNRSSIVWTESEERSSVIDTLSDDEYLAELRPRFGSFLGDISLVGKRHSYPLDLSIAQRFTAQRVALVGDAAHGVHPLAGQGLNLGFRDVASLAEITIHAARIGQDIGSQIVLDGYARWRRTDTAALVGATDFINKVFSNDNPLLRLGRDLGLGAINAMPAARRALMREAAGVTGDLPRLMRGQQI